MRFIKKSGDHLNFLTLFRGRSRNFQWEGVQILFKKKSGGAWAPTHSQAPCLCKNKGARPYLSKNKRGVHTRGCLPLNPPLFFMQATSADGKTHFSNCCKKTILNFNFICHRMWIQHENVLKRVKTSLRLAQWFLRYPLQF